MPIEVLSQTTTLLPIIEFLITTLFFIIELLPISTPLAIKQFFPISVELSILEYIETYEPFIKLNSSLNPN